MSEEMIFTCHAQVWGFLTCLVDKGISPWAEKAQAVLDDFTIDSDKLALKDNATELCKEWRGAKHEPKLGESHD